MIFDSISPAPGNLFVLTNNKVAILGHSFGVQNFASATSDSQRAVLYWLHMFTNGRIDYSFDRVFALAGDTTGFTDASRPGFISRLPAAINSGAGIVIVTDPTNDFAAGTSFENTVANMTLIFNALRSGGRMVVTWAPTPRAAPNALSSDGLLLQARYSNWLRQNAVSLGVIVADATPLLVDPTAATYAPVAGVTVADNLHLSIIGARLLGAALANVINPFLPLYDPLAYNISDAYDASKNPSGNLISNPGMRGTGGTISAGGSTASGTVADGWQLLVANGTGLTITASIVTAGVRRLQQIQVSGTPTAGNPSILLRQTPAYTNQLNSGDYLRARGYFEVDSGSTGITGVGIQQWTTDSSGSHAYRTGDSIGSNTNGFYPSDPFRGVLRTGGNLTAASPTGFYAQYGISGINNTAIAGTFRVSNLEIRKER